MPAKIEFRRVGLHYFSTRGETEALRDITFSIQPGEFVSIVGQSGCGKSTLLSLLCGLMQPTSGEVVIDGKRVTGPSRSVGLMLQQDTLFEWRSILDNTVLGAEIRGADMAAAYRRAGLLLDRYGLGEFKHHTPDQLSGGMRQRAALARTMCLEPDILLLDEPFSALDFQTRLSIADEVGAMKTREGKKAIHGTHHIPEAIAMADRVIVLSRRPGRVRSEHRIAFPSAGPERPSVLDAREAAEFPPLFKEIWEELDVHVE